MTPEFGNLGSTPRTAIVTGGARRIGAEIVRALAADGWTVLIGCYRSGEAGAALAAETGAKLVSADLAAADGPATLLAGLDGMPPPGLLVNNASIFEEDALDSFDVESWSRHMDANLRAPALLTQGFARLVPAGAGGLIVNLLDAKLAQPNPDFLSYTISKVGLAGVTELSARALAGQGIRVCAIAPAVTLVSGPQSRDNFDAVHTMTGLGRGVRVEDIVAALRFIVATPVLTGQTITLDAGQRFLGLPRDVQFMERT